MRDLREQIHRLVGDERSELAQQRAISADALVPRRFARRLVVVNVLNPKTALFFLAFLPQFTSADNGPMSLQLVVLGVTFIAVALVSDSAYAFAAATIANAARRSTRFSQAGAYASGVVYIGLGLATAVNARSK